MTKIEAHPILYFLFLFFKFTNRKLLHTVALIISCRQQKMGVHLFPQINQSERGNTIPSNPTPGLSSFKHIFISVWSHCSMNLMLLDIRY